MKKFNIYYALSGMIEVDAEDQNEAYHNLRNVEKNILMKNLSTHIFEVMETSYDNFYRCPKCKNKVQFLDYYNQHSHYLTKDGKPKKDFIFTQEEVHKDSHAFLTCDNNVCHYVIPYDQVFSDGSK